MSACICEPPTNPTIIGDFADTGGTLKCGGQNSCQSPAASTSGTFFKMREPFILECSGQNSCDKDFDVENVGSMCVTGDNAVGPNQQTGTFRLADADPDTGRINDVCCARPFRQTTGGAGANQPHCSSATFENVGSMYCTGDNSCNNLQITLSGESWMQQRLLMLDC